MSTALFCNLSENRKKICADCLGAKNLYLIQICENANSAMATATVEDNQRQKSQGNSMKMAKNFKL
jgi:hypothetical protein